jgi:hypothetical protein
MEETLNLELEALSSLVYTANASGSFDRAFAYNKELH